jgi:hypothetical protein
MLAVVVEHVGGTKPSAVYKATSPDYDFSGHGSTDADALRSFAGALEEQG